jgi:uncharacterized protein DUF4136
MWIFPMQNIRLYRRRRKPGDDAAQSRPHQQSHSPYGRAELTKKGWREVQPGEDPDLVVRYWANSTQRVNLAEMGNWGLYGPYIGSYWGWFYTTVSASSTREGSLIADLIDPRSKALDWASLSDSQNY